MGRTSLPIDALLPEIVASLKRRPALVIEAPPGAGKTTRVPAALLDAGFAEAGEIVVLQPRRLPARLAAARVAEERGERLGDTVGYTVRFEEAAGPRTRLRFVTEGILTRRLLADPGLGGVAAVVLDEFHERHLAGDLGLALLADLSRRRPDLRLVVMSATLDAEPVQDFLGDCPRIRSEGRLYPVQIEHVEPAIGPGGSGGGRLDTRQLASDVAAAVRRVLREGPDGDLLVFLPGVGEIRRTAEALATLLREQDLLVLPLHGELSAAEQRRAVEPADRRKVILSTNVAETSVTIDGVVAVIDSGLARLPSLSPWSGLPTLTVQKISQASAVQRAGRAGRTRPGRAVRLYGRHDFDSRRSFELPEIARLDLAEPLLALHALGVRRPASFAWFEPPPPASMAAAEGLLRRLGAVDDEGAITATGRELLRFPVHPRLGRLIVEGQRRGVGEQAAALAALIGERDIRERGGLSFQRPGSAGAGDGADDDADLLARLESFNEARRSGFSRDALRSLGLDGRAVEGVERVRRQLVGNVSRRSSEPAGGARARPPTPEAVDEDLAIATLAAFPDRVMKRRTGGAREAVLAGGGVALIGAHPPGDLLVAVDAEERGSAGQRTRSGVRIKLAVGIEPEWLLDVGSAGLADQRSLRFDERTERVEELTALSYGQIVLEEARRPAPPSAEASALLAAAACAAGPATLFPDASLVELGARLALLAEATPGEQLPVLDPAGWQAAITATCEGHISFAELRQGGIEGLLASFLSPAIWQRLRAETPTRLRLPGGREVPIHYEPDRPPWIESRMQDFFGMQVGPAVARGRVPLVVHLLAPNGRAVQVTRDLAGFWRQHYPALRRELGRRYPRHPWPEDGASAVPPPPKPPRPPR
jgi:ATP-dependent helicase HrpB